MAKRWYSVSVLSNFEKKIAEQIRTKVAEQQLEDVIDARDASEATAASTSDDEICDTASELDRFAALRASARAILNAACETESYSTYSSCSDGDDGDNQNDSQSCDEYTWSEYT